MNKLVCSLLTIVLAFAFASCEKEIINNGGKEKQGKSKFKTISFRINEEITTSETPLFAYTRGMVLMFIRNVLIVILILNLHTDCLTILRRLVLL